MAAIAATVYSRMFAPGLGIAEDPATGIASGPLGCYLVRHKLVAPEVPRAMLSLQGVKMGRPSHVHISIGVRDGEITSVRVGGEAVLAGEGTLYAVNAVELQGIAGVQDLEFGMKSESG